MGAISEFAGCRRIFPPGSRYKTLERSVIISHQRDNNFSGIGNLRWFDNDVISVEDMVVDH